MNALLPLNDRHDDVRRVVSNNSKGSVPCELEEFSFSHYNVLCDMTLDIYIKRIAGISSHR